MNPFFNKLYKDDIVNTVKNNPCIRNLAGKTIFITGSTGLIGSYIIELCLCANEIFETNIEIIASGLTIDELEKRFEGVTDSNLKFIEYNVNKDIDFEFRCDYIIHAASNAYPAAFSKYPVDTMLNNIIGTKNLLEYGSKMKASRLLYVSSGEVYGQMSADVESFSEEMSGYVDPMQVRSCYPMSKRASETLCASYTEQYGLETVVVRPCHCYGPNVTMSDNRATVQFMNDVINDRDIVLKSEGKQLRSYMYVADCAAAILTVLIKGESKQVYNIANRKSIVTIAEFAKITAKLGGKDVVFDIPNDGTGNTTPITKQILNCAKLESLGYNPLFDAESGIKRTYRILKDLNS